MAHVERTIEINADRQHVWAAIADLENVAVWNPNVASATCGSGPVGLGTSRTCHLTQGGHFDEVVSDWTPGQRMQFAIGSHGGIRSADMAMEVAASIGGTTVTAIADYHLAFGPLGPVIDRVVVKRQMARMLDDGLTGLKEHIEQIKKETQTKGTS